MGQSYRSIPSAVHGRIWIRRGRKMKKLTKAQEKKLKQAASAVIACRERLELKEIPLSASAKSVHAQAANALIKLATKLGVRFILFRDHVFIVRDNGMTFVHTDDLYELKE